ncbi:MAG: hypothetical protein SGJ18_07345 [Pseudomonadota bacterium]|nr:hypothetical protein [Pseudomonadota bacterium]
MDINAIPLPDQLPKKLDVSSLSKEQLESQAIENLLNQNDDLMARLSVNLKRALKLEQLNRDGLNKNKELVQKMEYLNDQVLILKEKSKHTIERKEKTERGFSEITSRYDELEKHHTDILIKTDQQSRFFEDTIENQKILLESAEVAYQKGERKFQRYQRRIKKYIAPVILELKSKFLDLADDCESLKSDWYHHREELEKKVRRAEKYRTRIKRVAPAMLRHFKQTIEEQKKFETQLQHLTTAHQELKGKSLETLNYIGIQKTTIDSQFKKIAELENQVLVQDSTLTQLKGENNKILLKSNSFEEKIVELDNRIIFDHRRLAEKNVQFQKDLDDAQSIIGSIRRENNEKDLSLGALNEEVEILRKVNSDLKIKNANLDNEVSSLTALWNDYRVRMDELKLKEESLRALNTELMLKLKAHREENDQLTEQKHTHTHYSKKRIDILSKENEVTLTQLNHLETLMAEIQSGFSKKPILEQPSLRQQISEVEDLSSQ